MTQDSTQESKYLLDHELPQLIEVMLDDVVGKHHPRPYEAICQNYYVANRVYPPYSAPHAQDRDIATLDFDVFALDPMGDAIVSCVHSIFASYDILTKFNIAITTFTTWVRTVRDNYHAENSFHNFRHAFNVLQTLHVFLTTFKARESFSDLEIFAMLVAALCHDLQHPGLTNAFLVATVHPLAVRYNNQAVLEHHHAAVAWAIVTMKGRDLLASLRGDGSYAGCAPLRQFREALVACIMATEVASHKAHVKSLRDALDSGTFNSQNVEHRKLLMLCLVQAADVSNECRGYMFSRQWAPLVAEEFFVQGDKEVALGMPPPRPSFDRKRASLPEDQKGFIAMLCLPLYEQLARIVPGIAECVASLRNNSAAWDALRTQRNSM